MNCIWLGQAGLLFDFDGVKVMIDPYLSDSVAKVNPANKRRVAVEDNFLNICPDILVLTHDHLDHTDPETLDRILNQHMNICVLASKNAWKHVRSYGNGHNYIQFDRLTQWSEQGLLFQAVHAQHSDDAAIGVLITYQDQTYYITGDTLYHDLVLEDVKRFQKHINAVFLPVNGVGNNMNMTDAARFVRAIDADIAVPVHFGLFDDLDPMSSLHLENKVIPRIYQQIPITF